MKHLLIEVAVTDKGQEESWMVGMLIEDALYGHMEACDNRVAEKALFPIDLPRVRVLSEEVPV